MTFPPVIILGLALLGGLVGYISGLFGVGGGFLVTPLLVSLFGIPLPIAVGSELTQMIAVGVTSARRHAAAGFVDTRLAACMVPGIIVGTYLGKAISGWLEGFGMLVIAGRAIPAINLVISLIFVVLLTSIAFSLWRDRSEEAEGHGGRLCWPRGPWTVSLPASGIARCSLVSLTAFGILLGILAGLLGIGGGVLLVPMLVIGFGLPMRVAIGTSALLILVSALSGSVQYAIAGKVDLQLAMILLVSSSVGVPIGTRQSHQLRVRHLQRAFAMLVLLVVVVVLARLGGYFMGDVAQQINH